MPANLPPDYFAAEKRLKQAREPEEKIRILEEMLAIMPKHKGTDHLKADLRAKIARLQREGMGKKQAKRTQNPYLVEKEGAAQVMLIGPPNSGKSQLLKTLCPSAQAVVEPYPYSTQKPVPGMMKHENVSFQLIDMPPIVNGKLEWWQAELLKLSDGAVLVLDVAEGGPLVDLEEIEQGLDGVNIKLLGTRDETVPIGVKGLAAIIAANKVDLPGAGETLEIFLELLEGRFEVVGISAVTGKGLGDLGKSIFDRLNIIRIYTKIPGRDPDMTDPYVLRQGATVMDLAVSVHKDFGEKLEYARVWGENTYDGQRVPRDYVLHDGDVVELHI
jgi:ribosome-interacting GTPase 1